MRLAGKPISVLSMALSAITVSTESKIVSAQQTPDFRSEVDLAEVDVVVTGHDGRPVQGLTVDDFELHEDGVPQQIVFFDAVATPTERTGGGSAQWPVR